MCSPEFNCGLFRLHDMDILTSIADCSINHPDSQILKWAHGGRDRLAEDAYFSMTPDPTFAFVGVYCCRTLDFVSAVWIMITFDTLSTSLYYFLWTNSCK
jgi:hypothetical protein